MDFGLNIASDYHEAGSLAGARVALVRSKSDSRDNPNNPRALHVTTTLFKEKRIPILRPDAIMADTFTDRCLSFVIYQDLKRHLDAESQAPSGTCPDQYADQIRSSEHVLSYPMFTHNALLLPCLIFFFIFPSPGLERVTLEA